MMCGAPVVRMASGRRPSIEMMATRPGANEGGALGVGVGAMTGEGPDGCERPHADATYAVAATSRATSTRERTPGDPAKRRPRRTVQEWSTRPEKSSQSGTRVHLRDDLCRIADSRGLPRREQRRATGGELLV